MKQFVGVTTDRRLLNMDGTDDENLDNVLGGKETEEVGGGQGAAPAMAEPVPGIGIGTTVETKDKTQAMPPITDQEVSKEMQDLETELGLSSANISSLDTMIRQLRSVNEIVKKEVLSEYDPSVRWIAAAALALKMTTVDKLDQKQMGKLQARINGHLANLDKLTGTAETEINLLYKEQDKLSDLRQKSQRLSDIYDNKYTQLTAQYGEKEQALKTIRAKPGTYAEQEVLSREISHTQKERQEIMEKDYTVQAGIRSYFKRDIACKRQVALREKVKVKTFEAKALFYQIKAAYAETDFGPPVGIVNDGGIVKDLANVLQEGEVLQDYIVNRAKIKKSHTQDFMDVVDGMTARSPASGYLKDESTGASNPTEIIKQAGTSALNKLSKARDKLKTENQKMYEGR